MEKSFLGKAPGWRNHDSHRQGWVAIAAELTPGTHLKTRNFRRQDAKTPSKDRQKARKTSMLYYPFVM